jgi:uridine monophosphate synthetase
VGFSHSSAPALCFNHSQARPITPRLRAATPQNLRLHAALPITRMLDTLVAHGKVTEAVASDVRAFLAANQTSVPAAASLVTGQAVAAKAARLTYGARAQLAGNAAGKRLLECMERKRSNLCVAADVTTCEGVLRLAAAIGPHICCLKTHADMLSDFTPAFGTALAALAAEHDFLVFEDRKFADIGNTVVTQYGGGVHAIADWSDLTNAHCVPGPGIIDGLAQVGLPKGRGLLLLAEMSSKGTLAGGSYTQASLDMALARPDFVCGFISIRPASWPKAPPPGLVHMTPGVQLAAGGDALGQQYLTPDSVVCDQGSDVIIVGRGILAAKDQGAAAEEYKRAGWAAYEKALAM